MAIKNIVFKSKQYSLSYELLNHTSKESILFLHGWGANKELMKIAFGGFLKEYCHIYLDFPGFGSSSIEEPLSSFDVRDITKEFLSSIGKNPQIIAGHSFGGKVALLLNPKNIVLLSSSGIVLPKRLWVKIKIKLFKIAKFFGLKRFYKIFASQDVKGMDSVMYETFKKVVNEDMSEYFKNYKGTAVIFWGKDDDTTPIVAAQKITSLIKNSTLFELQGDHFFFLDKGGFISEMISEKLKD
ncbi:MAG: alpha/beta hydrolase [Campylobacteraceae bacterium]|jgi:pimeloyl-ACP methyl ester carboxylesterase|nr:alpha/beta hydrolase [Campylobacteraceae bacterium]